MNAIFFLTMMDQIIKIIESKSENKFLKKFL